MKTFSMENAISLTDSILGGIESAERDHGIDYIGGIKQDAQALKRVLDHLKEKPE